HDGIRGQSGNSRAARGRDYCDGASQSHARREPATFFHAFLGERRRCQAGEDTALGTRSHAGQKMKWVTRERIHVNRTATAWLIRRFLDPTAEILFVEPGKVAAVQKRENATGFDAPGARYPHQDERGRCSFEQLVDEHFTNDTALQRL